MDESQMKLPIIPAGYSKDIGDIGNSLLYFLKIAIRTIRHPYMLEMHWG